MVALSNNYLADSKSKSLLFYTGIPVLFIFMLCCGTRTDVDKPEYHVFEKPQIVDKSVDLSVYIEDIKYIPLSDEPSTFLHYANTIFAYDELIIVRDGKTKSNTIYFFDTLGKLQWKDNHLLADYPVKEYVTFDFTDFTLDADRNTLYMSDASRRHIVSYNIKTREKKRFLDSIYAVNLHYHSNKLLIYTNDKIGGLLKMYEIPTGELLGEYILDSKPNVGIGATINNPMADQGDSVWVGLFFSDTVYIAKGNTVKPAVVLGNDPNTSVRYSGVSEIEEVYWQNKKDKYPYMAIPWGEVAVIHNIIAMAMFNFKYYIIKPGQKRSYLVSFEYISKNNKIFSEIFLRSIREFEGYFYSYIKLTETFYETTQHLLQSPDHVALHEPLSKLIQDYPPERKFQNPVITRFKISDDFMEAFR